MGSAYVNTCRFVLVFILLLKGACVHRTFCLCPCVFCRLAACFVSIVYAMLDTCYLYCPADACMTFSGDQAQAVQSVPCCCAPYIHSCRRKNSCRTSVRYIVLGAVPSATSLGSRSTRAMHITTVVRTNFVISYSTGACRHQYAPNPLPPLSRRNPEEIERWRPNALAPHSLAGGVTIGLT